MNLILLVLWAKCEPLRQVFEFLVGDLTEMSLWLVYWLVGILVYWYVSTFVCEFSLD